MHFNQEDTYGYIRFDCYSTILTCSLDGQRQKESIDLDAAEQQTADGVSDFDRYNASAQAGQRAAPTPQGNRDHQHDPDTGWAATTPTLPR
jgi:hypothetical protein